MGVGGGGSGDNEVHTVGLDTRKNIETILAVGYVCMTSSTGALSATSNVRCWVYGHIPNNGRPTQCSGK